MVVALGTPMNLAVLQRQLEMNVVNFGPFTVARSMTEPLHKLKFGVYSSYYDQIRAGLKYFVEKKGKKTPCVMYVDNEGGQEMLEGARDQAKAMKLALAAESAHKPTDTDFTGAITKLREAKCEVVFMGTIVRDTIIPYSTARKLGWDATFVGTSASYENVVATAQGGITEGFYTLNGQEVIYPDQIESPEAKAFFEKYKAKYGQDPFYPAQLGYGIGDVVVGTLKEVGKDLTTEKFLKAFESIKDRVGPLGGPPVTFTSERHLGSDLVFLAVVEKGRWKSVERNLKY
jgi:branched-chain amino acid transport system substrate-binding protein